MDLRIKKLLGFLTVEKPSLLLTPCSLREEEWVKEINAGEVKCTDVNCDKEDKNCIKMHPQGLYLPIEKFDVWIVDPRSFPYSPGYAFYLAHTAMKKFGIFVLTHLPDDLTDSVALSYGFQILYHGEWHYYLKAT